MDLARKHGQGLDPRGKQHYSAHGLTANPQEEMKSVTKFTPSCIPTHPTPAVFFPFLATHRYLERDMLDAREVELAVAKISTMLTGAPLFIIACSNGVVVGLELALRTPVQATWLASGVPAAVRSSVVFYCQCPTCTGNVFSCYSKLSD